MSQWADAHRKLSSEASAEPGQWNTDRAPFQRGMMDCINDPTVDTVVVMSSAQVGKTEILLCVIGYYMDFDPSPILLIQPTLQMAETFSKDRLAPMLRDTPSLKGKVKDPRARDSGNTLLHKSFPGGHITMAGANSPASLASRPIRIFLADEVDRYPESAGTEGDPLLLGAKRTTTFWNRKKVYVSTPTVKGASRIEAAYTESDQRRYHVPCPHCGGMQSLKWKQVKWEKGKPDSAWYECAHCNQAISESHKLMMLRRGRWIAGADFVGVAGFHINELYSPWRRWSDVVFDFLSAKRSKETLKTWVNTSLGETFEEETEGVDAGAVTRLREDYEHPIPEGVQVLTIGADVQQDRIEAELVGWGEGEESWSIEYQIFQGDTKQRDCWDAFDAWIKQRHQSATGGIMSAESVVIDSGYNTQMVYDFVKRVRLGYVHAGKGMHGFGVPIVEDQRKRLRRRQAGVIDPQRIGVNEAKLLILNRLQIENPGPGYCHFPLDYDDEYFEQLTAERLVTKFKKGYTTQEFVKTRPRNEALDCRAYALAARKLLPIVLKRHTIDGNKPERQPVKPLVDRPREPRRRSNPFLDGHL